MPIYNKLSVYDRDGVLTCSMHRYKTDPATNKIDLRYWIENEHKHGQDAPLPMLKQYQAELLEPETFVIIATAADLNTHGQLNRIRDFYGQPNAVVSRMGRADTRSGVKMKSEGILAVINAHGLHQVKNRHVYEDNKDYLIGVCEIIEAIPHFIESNQGH